jgi:hypothetical protein
MNTPVLLVLFLAVFLSACAGAPSKNVDLWREQVRLQQEAQARAAREQAEQQATITAQAAGCVDDACRVAIAGFAALSARAVAAAAPAALPPAPYERDSAAKFRDVLSGLTPLASTVVGAAVSWRQSDNSRALSEAQYGFLESVVIGTANAAVEIAQAGPRVEVGGDYISGQVGDNTAGNGNATRGSQIGDNAGGDQIGRDRNDGSVVGDGNRFVSPGPFRDYSDNDCEAGDGGNAGGGDTTGGGAPGSRPGGAGGSCGG